MLDKKCMSVFETLKSLSTDNNYKVITVEELQVHLKGYSATTIKQCMDTLTRMGYISIKFNEDDTYCYSIIKKQTKQELAKEKPSNNKLMYLFVALASFVGSFLAFLLFVLIF